MTRTLKNVNAGIRVQRFIERYEINLPSGICTSVHQSLGRQQKIGEYFFSKRIRFIAVTDQYDTASVDQSNGGIMLPLKNMINEAYALDIAKKIIAPPTNS